MTKTFTNTLRNATIALALVTSFSTIASTASFAYSAEAREQCTGDAFRLCSSEIPNISKVTACMIAKKAQLSTGCRSVMDKELAANKTRKLSSAE